MSDFQANSSKDRSGRSQEEDRKDKLLNELSRSLDIVHHDNPIRHTFGGAFEAPVTVTPTAIGDTVGFVGISDSPARSDHRHGTDAPATPAWESLTSFSNGWGNFSGYTTRVIVINNVCYFDGVISAGTIGTGVTALSIPVGRRPTQIQNLIVIASAVFQNYVSIEPNGNLSVQNGSNTWVSLASIQYPLF